MPRPFKLRCVGRIPDVTVFKPAGVPARDLRHVELHFDELEAMRLVDGEGMDQAQAAESMRVSRPSVGRILERARKKVALALVEGQAIFIEQGAAPVLRQSPVRRRAPGKGGKRG
jgi:uncharacterized protein